MSSGDIEVEYYLKLVKEIDIVFRKQQFTIGNKIPSTGLLLEILH